MEPSVPGNPLAPPSDRFARLNLQNCYQCGKCTAGCPMAAGMDIVPNQVIRLLQSGHAERAVLSNSIWACVSCQTCSSRCPKSVDCCGVMDALRQLAFERGTFSEAGRKTVFFLESFLDSVRRGGRLNELGLTASFKMRAFLTDWNVPFLLKEAGLAPKLYSRGKLRLRSRKVADREIVERIFARCMPQPGTVHAPETESEAGT
jgi:heterodisulfide reductase subunit C